MVDNIQTFQEKFEATPLELLVLNQWLSGVYKNHLK